MKSFRILCIQIFLLFQAHEILYSQIIDKYSEERDVILFEEELFKKGDTLSFKRILVPLEQNEVSYSIRKGREVLVLYNKAGKIVQRFDEICGYSTLFVDLAVFSFDDLNQDSLKDLTIFIRPFESLPSLWLYTNNGKRLKFLERFQVESYEFNNSELKTAKYALIDNWDDLTDEGYITGLPTLIWYDYYRVRSDSLISINSNHKLLFKTLLAQYENRLKELRQMRNSKSEQWKIDIIEMEITGCLKLISKCQNILVSKDSN